MNDYEQYYNRIKTYANKYGTNSLIKLTQHAAKEHMNLNDEQLINRLFINNKKTQYASVFDINEQKLNEYI